MKSGVVGCERMDGEEAVQAALAAVLGGDVEAFRELVRACGPVVERVISAHVLPHEVPEVAHETFVRAYRSLGTYGGRGSFSGWLTVIALRCCYERLRERYRPEATFSTFRTDSVDEEQITIGASLERYHEECERVRLREELDSALNVLPPGDRMLLTLTFLEGWTVAEAAAALNISAVNARVRIHRGKHRLRRLLLLPSAKPPDKSQE